MTAASQDDASVALDGDGEIVIAWSTANQDSADSGVFARSFSAAGVPRHGNEFLVNTVVIGRQDFPVVAYQGDGAAVIAWESDTNGRLRRPTSGPSV